MIQRRRFQPRRELAHLECFALLCSYDVLVWSALAALRRGEKQQARILAAAARRIIKAFGRPRVSEPRPLQTAAS